MGWFYVFLTIGIAIGFYWLRLRHRLWYAFSEILVALVLIYVAIFPAQTHALLTEGSWPLDVATAWVTKIVTLFGAVYVFVRGLDNIDTALPSLTWRMRWCWVTRAARRWLS